MSRKPIILAPDQTHLPLCYIPTLLQTFIINWQRYGESNPGLVVESHSCYHYTISPLAGIARIELNFFRVKAECNKPLYDIPVLKNNVVKDCMTYTTNNIRFIIVVFCSSLILSSWFVSISANL